MRAGASLGWRVATAMAIVATAVLAVTLGHGAPIKAALASDKGTNAAHAPSSQAAGSTQAADMTALCEVSGLRISLGPGARVTTEITRYPLDFTNVSDEPCMLAGYPQVWAYRGDGLQVGPAAVHDTSVAASRVLLAPGETAHASLDALVPAARCIPVRASGLRVVPPGQTAARYVQRPLTACTARASKSQGYLRVHAIQAGAGASASAGGSPESQSARRSLN